MARGLQATTHSRRASAPASAPVVCLGRCGEKSHGKYAEREPNDQADPPAMRTYSMPVSSRPSSCDAYGDEDYTLENGAPMSTGISCSW